MSQPSGPQSSSSAAWSGDGAQRAEGFSLGPWRIEPDVHVIHGPEGPTQVEHKVMQVLLYLAARPEQTVRVDELLDAVWGEVIVEENALRRSISLLRKAFGDNPRQPTVIQTIPKRGYRLFAPVTFAPAGGNYPASPADVTLSPAPEPSPQRAAVLADRTRWRIGSGIVVGVLALVAVGWVVSQAWAPPTLMTKRPLSSFPGVEYRPSLSPDGSKVVYVWEGDDPSDTPKIYVQLVDEAVPQRLTSGDGAEAGPAWSPDGNRIAFTRYADGTCGILVAPVIGQQATQLAACTPGQVGTMAWSPDGRWLAFPARPDSSATRRIVLLDTQTLERRTLTTPPDHHGDFDPRFSPDGTRLSFERRSPTSPDMLMRIPTAGGTPSVIVEAWGGIENHDWTPDGARIVFSSDQGGNYRLWAVDAGGGTPEWLAAAGVYDPSTPAFARTGQRMAYVEWFFTFNIWQVQLDNELGEPQPLITSSQWDMHPHIAPDGQRLAFTSNRLGNNDLWTSDADGTDLQRLTDFGTAFVSTPRWSPDGQRLAFVVREATTPDLYVIDAAGGTPRRLTDHTAADVAPAWSPDGAWLYFGSNRSGTWQIWRKPSNGGAAEQVTTDGGYAAQIVGETLFYTRPDQRGLWRQSLTEASEATDMLPNLSPSDWGSWVVQNDTIYFLERTPNGAFISAHDLTTGATTRLATPTQWIPQNKANLTISPDGRTLIYSQSDQRESDIMLIEDFR